MLGLSCTCCDVSEPVNPSIQPKQATSGVRYPVRRPAGNSMGLQQAYVFRNMAANEAIALSEQPVKNLMDRIARARAFQSLATVWVDACERIRISKGRPLPGSLRPSKAEKPVRKPSTLPTELPE